MKERAPGRPPTPGSASTSTRRPQDQEAPGRPRPSPSRSATGGSSPASTSSSRRGCGSGWSVPTAAARPPCSRCSPAPCSPTAARSSGPTAPARRPASSRAATPSTAASPCGGPSPRRGTRWSTMTGSIHVASWAKRFLFRSEQLDTPVSRLLRGEQARILIARLMLRAGRPPDPRRADQRPRHPDPGSAGGEPPGVPWRPGPRHPRPLPSGPNVCDLRPGPRRQRRSPVLRRYRAVGGAPQDRRSPGQAGRPQASGRRSSRGEARAQEALLQGEDRMGGGWKSGSRRPRRPWPRPSAGWRIPPWPPTPPS